MLDIVLITLLVVVVLGGSRAQVSSVNRSGQTLRGLLTGLVTRQRHGH